MKCAMRAPGFDVFVNLIDAGGGTAKWYSN